jgi:TolB-like protein
MPDIFLSYSREDQPTARRFAEALQREGFTVWWDQSLRSGEAYDKVTETALREAGAVIVLWSPVSVESRWVRSEATTADRRGTLMPVMIEPCERPIMFELTHTVDLCHWKGEADDPAWRTFVSDVRQFIDGGRGQPSSSNANANANAQPTPSGATGVRRRTGLFIAAASAALLLAGATMMWFSQHRADEVQSDQAAAPKRTGPVTLAVLPFADMSQAKDQEYFSDGLTEEILNQLAQVRDMRVTGRTSSFSFKGQNEDLRTIASRLNVDNLLEGSIRKDGENLRITAQLVDGWDGAHLWSKTYDRELKQVFAVQEEIARDVAQALSVTLDVGAASRATGGTTDIEAYDRYLQARSLSLGGGVESSRKAIRFLREAVALDPDFSRAWLLLATNLGLVALSVPESEAVNLRKERDAAIQRGVALAPDSFAASTVRLSGLVDRRQWSEADELFRKVSATTGRGGEIQLEAGGFLASLLATGHFKDVVENLKVLVEIEPLSLVISENLQIFQTAIGELDAAQAEYVRSQPLAGSHSRSNLRQLLRMIYRGSTPQAVQEQFRAQANVEGLNLPLQQAVIDSLGDRAAALDLLRQAFGNPSNQNQPVLTTLYLFADALGDRDLALAALRKLVMDFNSPLNLWLAPHSGVRSDPRFKQLLRETGLADFYRASGDWGDFCRPVGETDFECS